MPGLELWLAEEAKLLKDGRPVPVRKRGLALLAMLALGFEARRARLAEVLWRHGAALNNLRVELHALRAHFPGWAVGEDPLSLPPDLRVRRQENPELRNLRGISPELDAWLRRLSGALEPLGLSLPELEPPFVLVLRRPPLLEREAVLAEVFRRWGGRARVLEPGGEAGLRELFRRPDEGWVVLLAPFGEEPAPLAALGARLQRLEPGAWSWTQARKGLLKGLSFVEAARIYLASGGDPWAMRAMAAASSAMPAQVRAAYVRELWALEPGLRRALEGLSVHPGPVPERVLWALGLLEAAAELQRWHWLIARGSGWAFRYAVARRAILAGLGAGWRRVHHARFARAFAAAGEPYAAAYHAWMAGVYWPLPAPREAWARATLWSAGVPLEPRALSRGEEAGPVALEVERGRAEAFGRRVVWTRDRLDPEATEVSFALPGGPTLLCLDVRAYARNALRVGLSGDAVPLFLEVGDRRVDWTWVPRPFRSPKGAVLPLEEAFRHWLALPQSRRARLGSRAESGVFELKLTLYDLPESARGHPQVLAFPL